jgi:hypothetical protein
VCVSFITLELRGGAQLASILSANLYGCPTWAMWTLRTGWKQQGVLHLMVWSCVFPWCSMGLRVNHNRTPTHQHAFGNFPQILLTAYTVCASAKFGSEHLQDDDEICLCAEHTNMCVSRKLGFCILAYNNCLLFQYI